MVRALFRALQDKRAGLRDAVRKNLTSWTKRQRGDLVSAATAVRGAPTTLREAIVALQDREVELRAELKEAEARSSEIVASLQDFSDTLAPQKLADTITAGLDLDPKPLDTLLALVRTASAAQSPSHTTQQNN